MPSICSTSPVIRMDASSLFKNVYAIAKAVTDTARHRWLAFLIHIQIAFIQSNIFFMRSFSFILCTTFG